MTNQTISVRQLRENFPEFKEQLEDGYNFTLVYHSIPLANITPFASSHKSTGLSKAERIRRNVVKVKKLAGGWKFKTAVTPERINQMLDERYEEMLH